MCYVQRSTQNNSISTEQIIFVMMYLVPAGDTTVLEDYTTPDY
jgi:hypothetical protein